MADRGEAKAEVPGRRLAKDALAVVKRAILDGWAAGEMPLLALLEDPDILRRAS